MGLIEKQLVLALLRNIEPISIMAMVAAAAEPLRLATDVGLVFLELRLIPPDAVAPPLVGGVAIGLSSAAFC